MSQRKQLECTQCGHDNELSSMFCRECGAKLDHTKVKLDVVKKSDKKGGGLGKVFRIVQVLIFLVIVAAAVVVFWPVEPVGEVGDAAQAQELNEKITRLHDACENGIGMETIVSEQAINAHLAETVSQQAGSGGPAIDYINVMIDRGVGVRIVTKVKLGPVPLVYTVTGDPVAGQGPFHLDVKEVKLGIVPVPSALQEPLVLNKVERVFEGLEPERFVLDRLESLEPARARVRLTTKGG